MKTRGGRSRLRTAVALALSVLVMLWSLAAVPAQAGGSSVRAVRINGHLTGPALVVPAGQGALRYAAWYRGATPGASRLEIMLSEPDGSTEAAPVQRLARVNGVVRGTLSQFPSYPPGLYRLTVFLDGRVERMTAFTIASGFAVTQAYITTSFDVTLLRAGRLTMPRPVHRLPPDVHSLAYYVAYVGATPDTTRLSVRLYAAGGLLRTASTTYRLQYRDGYVSDAFQSLIGLPVGTYRLDVAADGHVAATWSVRVGGPQKAHKFT